ncbi:MAG: DEAD/DEAH box helicase [Candidatus Wallbacteria bacterium]
MSELIFNSLNEKIRNYIANNLKWPNFTEIQKMTIPHINAGKDCLIISPTGSGKTEAAFIPILNKILNKKTNGRLSLECIYIAPLRTLINDMSIRLKKWCESTGLTINSWHSDICSFSKNKFINNPSNILLITPESIESILFNKSDDIKKKIFSEIKFIVVDEIHAFHKNNRGKQLSSLIKRIEKYSAIKPQKIGISATIEGPHRIMEWFSSENKEKQQIIQENKNRNIKILIKKGTFSLINQTILRNQDKKILIFASSRKNCEIIIMKLKQLRLNMGLFIHHSSLSKEIREEAETNFKNNKAAVMISSGTFELGIDIGDIDFIIHYGEFKGSAQARQRIGRAGRRQNTSKCLNIVEENTQLIISLAVTNLINNGKIEKQYNINKPYDIYLHQILAIISEKSKISPEILYKTLSSAKEFAQITLDEYNEIIAHLNKNFFIEILNGYLYQGKDFEKEFGGANFKNFYAVFETQLEFKVESNLKIIGTLDYSYVMTHITPGEKFTISGHTYVAISLDYKRYLIKARPVKSAQIPQWYSQTNSYEYETINEAYKIICSNITTEEENKLMNSLDDHLKNYYIDFSEKSKKLNLSCQNIYIDSELTNNEINIITFAGINVNNVLKIILENLINKVKISITPFIITISFESQSENLNANCENIKNILQKTVNFIKNSDSDIFVRLIENSYPKIFLKNKFAGYLPEKLHKKLYLQKFFDLETTVEFLSTRDIKITNSNEIKKYIIKNFI